MRERSPIPSVVCVSYKRYYGCYEDFYKVLIFVIQTLVMQIAFVYDEMVLKLFTNANEQPHVKSKGDCYLDNILFSETFIVIQQ